MTAKEYLEQHGISKEIADLYEITSNKNYLHIPIKDQKGNTLFINSRFLNYSKDSKESKYKNSKNSKATLFNLDTVSEDNQIILCEGEIDAIRLSQEGIPAISSTGGSSTFTQDFADQLSDKQILICYDNDLAGTKGIQNVLNLIPNAKIIKLPQNSKDVCEFFSLYKSKDFFKLIEESITKTDWELISIPPEHQLINGKTLNNMKFESMPWLIDGILYNEGFCFIYGAEGIGKSFITLSMAKAVATGQPWMDTFNVSNTTNVLFLDLENPLSLTAKRMYGLGGAPNNLYWLQYPSGFSLHNGNGGPSDFALNVRKLVQANNIGLIIIDSFVDLMVGNSNSAEDTQIFFSALRELFPSVAFLVLHHENKPSAGTYRNSGQRLRGSTNINAQTFTMFRLEAVPKSKTEMTLEQTKSRDEQKMDPFLVRMDVVPNKNKTGTIVTGFSYLGIIANNEEKRLTESEDLIINALTEAYKSQMTRQGLLALARAGGLSESTFNRTLKNMENTNLIKKSKQGRSTLINLCDPIVNENEDQKNLI